MRSRGFLNSEVLGKPQKKGALSNGPSIKALPSPSSFIAVGTFFNKKNLKSYFTFTPFLMAQPLNKDFIFAASLNIRNC